MKKKLNTDYLLIFSTLAFASMLQQECGWFDDKNNSVGSLSARLSADAAHVQSVRCTIETRTVYNTFLLFIFLGNRQSTLCNFAINFNSR